jgi:hypothetical protein
MNRTSRTGPIQLTLQIMNHVAGPAEPAWFTSENFRLCFRSIWFPTSLNLMH